MGSIADMHQIRLVLEQHGKELEEEWAQEVPEILKPLFRKVRLSNEIDHVRVEWEFRDGATLPGPGIDIDVLAERFPGCEVGH